MDTYGYHQPAGQFGPQMDLTTRLELRQFRAIVREQWWARQNSNL